VPPTASPPQFQILDGAHSGGNPHFFFLPPLVPAPTFSGTSDGTQKPVVKVCEWSGTTCLTRIAEFSMTGATAAQVIRYDAQNQLYIVNWPTGRCVSGPCTLDPTKTYRLRVLIGVAELGHADLKVVQTSAGLKTIDPTQYIGVLQGSTVPVKFRIEQGAVLLAQPGTPTPVGASGGTLTSADGKVGLIIPPTALSTSTPITVAPSTGAVDPGILAGSVYDLEPSGTTFATPVTLTIQYDPSKIPAGLHESSLKLYENSGAGWQRVPGSGPSLTDHTVSGGISHFSEAASGMPVAAVTVTPATAQVTVGATVQLTATTTDSGGNVVTDRQVTWASADPSLATVDETGLVSGVSAGPVTITTTSEGVTGSAALVVVATVVTSLADDGSPGTLRQVLATAPSGSTITFADNLCSAGTSCTIGLLCSYNCENPSHVQLVIGTSVAIVGPIAYQLVLQSVSTPPSTGQCCGAPPGTVLWILTGATVAMSNVMITGGQTSDFLPGAILNEGTLTLTHVTVSGNFGCGLCHEAIGNGGTLTLNNSTVSGNCCGGIGNSGVLTLDSSAVSGNTSSGRCDAGGIGNGGSAMLRNSTVSGNSACGRGAGILSSGTLALDHTVVSDNFNRNGRGGGIYIVGGTVALTNVTVSGNRVRQGDGGGMVIEAGTVTLTNTTVSGNSALEGSGTTTRGGNGGGIFNQGALTVTSSTVSANSAFTGSDAADGGGGNGGGVFNQGTLTISSSTVSGNSAQLSGGGIFSYSGSLTLSSSRVSGNSAPAPNPDFTLPNGGSGIWTAGTVDLTDGSTVCNNTELPNIVVSPGGVVNGTANCPDL